MLESWFIYNPTANSNEWCFEKKTISLWKNKTHPYLESDKAYIQDDKLVIQNNKLFKNSSILVKVDTPRGKVSSYKRIRISVVAAKDNRTMTIDQINGVKTI